MDVLLTRTHPLPDGTRVRLRLPQPGDRAGLTALHDRLGAPLDDMRMSRILRFDPRACVSVCATILDGKAELLAPGVTELLEAALAQRTHARRVA